MNIFQLIKKMKTEAEAAGIKIINMSIGQPTGPALEGARLACAQAVMVGKQNMHEYQDNGCLPLPNFARDFAQFHVRTDLSKVADVDYLPIPGIKPMLPLVPLACGASKSGYDLGVTLVQTVTEPGYKVPETWCASYMSPKFVCRPLVTTPENQFLFDPEKIEQPTDLVMMNYPHNPSGQISPLEWLEKVCRVCSDRGVRLFNDSAYTILAGEEHYSLTDVAVKFPNLSWAEAFSASKAGNFTGWRVGSIIGSPDFVGDIRTIKGNTDSGFFAPAAIGALMAFQHSLEQIKGVSYEYAFRIGLLMKALESRGMKMAVQPKAGFFTLWMSPKRAFGQDIENAAQFNELMIKNTGIMGVPFDPYIRYAVVEDIQSMLPDIESGFDIAKVSY